MRINKTQGMFGFPSLHPQTPLPFKASAMNSECLNQCFSLSLHILKRAKALLMGSITALVKALAPTGVYSSVLMCLAEAASTRSGVPEVCEHHSTGRRAQSGRVVLLIHVFLIGC